MNTAPSNAAKESRLTETLGPEQVANSTRYAHA